MICNNKVLYRLFRYLKKYKFKLFIIIFLFVITGFISFYLPLLFRDFLDKGLSEHDFKRSIILVFMIFTITVISYIIEFIKEKVRVFVKSEISKELYRESINKILNSKIQYLKTSTEIYNNIDEDIQNMSSIMDDAIFFAVTQIFSIFGGIVGIFYINWKLACVVILLLPIKYLISTVISKKREKISCEKLKEKSYFSVWCESIINSIKSIKLWHLNSRVKGEFEQVGIKFIQSNQKLEQLTAFNELIDGMMITILTSIIYILSSIFYFHNQITVGGIFSFCTYFINISTPITSIMNIRFIIAGIIPSAERLFSFFDVEEETKGSINIRKEEFSTLELKNIEFSYEGLENLNKSQIKNISFKLFRGQKIAILGKNGSGKSTLLNLLLRFYTPQSGEILLNDRKIDMYSLTQYRKLFAVVDQNIYLINDSIMGNIEVEKNIVNSSILHKLSIYSLVKKYQDRECGINGAKLSLGEKQKIAIARALNSDAEIFIFDEATSSIDLITTRNFWSLILNELNGKTILCVTHNYDNLQFFDKILILKEGKIVYFGDYSKKIVQTYLL